MKQDQKEVLKAWIDGKTIQYQDTTGKWHDCRDYEQCDVIKFDRNDKYRIKPKILITETRIDYSRERYIDTGKFFHDIDTDVEPKNLRLTWYEGNLIKAEVI